jgi:hypothetical protein
MLSEAFKQLEAESKNAGLTIKESKTKYTINSRNKVRFWNVGSYKFERDDKFKYLRSLVTEISEDSTEIKIRTAAGNRLLFCYQTSEVKTSCKKHKSQNVQNNN